MFLFNSVPSISTNELQNKLKDRPVIIDVRSPQEFQAGHISGAQNVPLQKIASFQPKEKTYVICLSGMRSKKAAKLLAKKGYDVVNVRGGMQSWSGPTKGGKY